MAPGRERGRSDRSDAGCLHRHPGRYCLPKTVYVGFETKANVLNAVWDARLGDDEEAIPVLERTWYRSLVMEPDPERKLRIVAAQAREVNLDQATCWRSSVTPRRQTPRSPPSGARFRRSSSTFSAQLSSSWSRARRSRAVLMLPPRRTFSGRSTTRAYGAPSSASAAGARSSTIGGWATHSVHNFSVQRVPPTPKSSDS